MLKSDDVGTRGDGNIFLHVSDSSYDANALSGCVPLDSRSVERPVSRMKTFDLSDFSDLLLELYRLAREKALDDFQDAALNLIKPHVPFDTSIWGTATMRPGGVDIHQVHLHKTSQEMLDAYELVKHEDVSAISLHRRGTATDAFHSKTLFARTECGEFLRRFEHENYFVSMETTPASGFLHWISLYRTDREAHCTADERDLVETLRPHLMQALSLNRSHHQERLAPHSPGLKQGFAIVDLRGVIYQADDLFETLMCHEWGTEPGDLLPLPLMSRFLAGDEQVVARTLVVRRHVEHGLLFLRARARCRADALTVRERAIAHAIARGETHKEIAQGLARAPATVRNQIQTIYAKLEVGSIAGLIEAIRPLQ